MKNVFPDEDINIDEKIAAVDKFVKLTISEKKKYFTTSKYEILTLDENLENLSKNEKFNQQNFKNLIEKCKTYIKTEREDRIYIENLKNEILILENEKNRVIEKTKSIIEELRSDNLSLIDKIDRMNKDKEKVEKEKSDLLRKTEDIYKKTQENYLLKNEIEKTKTNLVREKNRIAINKEKEIEQLWDKVKYNSKFEKELTTQQKENAQMKNLINECKVEINRLQTENERLNCQIFKLETVNHKLNEAFKKCEEHYREARSTISFLVNSEPFKEMKNLYKSIENLQVMNETFNSDQVESSRINSNNSIK